MAIMKEKIFTTSDLAYEFARWLVMEGKEPAVVSDLEKNVIIVRWYD